VLVTAPGSTPLMVVSTEQVEPTVASASVVVQGTVTGNALSTTVALSPFPLSVRRVSVVAWSSPA
jgi:hypothetical protein